MAAPRSAALVLKSVKSIAVRMCPYEGNVRATRDFLEILNSKKVRNTNSNCAITVDVKHDKSEPLVDVNFVDGERLLIKSANVTCKEMILKLGVLCSAKDIQAKDAAKK